MNNSIQAIPLEKLAIISIPVIIVILFRLKWASNGKETIIVIGRMLLQLTLIGYVLTYIFETTNQLLVLVVLSIMLLAASWIALLFLLEL